MKRIRSFIILVLALLFVPSIAKASSKWDTKVINIPSNTEGVKIELNIDYYWGSYADRVEIVYTITDNYDYQANHGNVDFRFNDVIKAIDDVKPLNIGMQPGDSFKVNVKVVNESNYIFKYSTNSLKVSTFDYSDFEEDEMLVDNHETKIAIFDGNNLPIQFAAARTPNVAIMDLFVKSDNYTSRGLRGGVFTISMNEDGTKNTCQISSASKYALSKYSTNPDSSFGSIYVGCDNYLTDEVIDRELKARGYENGLDDLPKYYVDYYNMILGENYTSLEDIPNEVLATIFDSAGGRRILETNNEVASLGYNLLHNHLLTVIPNGKDSDDKYAVGGYMRDYNNGISTDLEKDFASTLAVVKVGQTYEIPEFEVHLDGTTGNAYQNYILTFTFGFSLEDGNPKAEEVIIKDGPEVIEKVTEVTPFDYTINYNATVKNVFSTEEGTKNVVVTFVDTPEYIVDITKSDISNNKDGVVLSTDYDFDIVGEYDSTNNLIQWLLTIYNVDTKTNGDLRILLNKNISLVYRDINNSINVVHNNVSANLRIDNSNGTSTKFIDENEEWVESIETDDDTKTTLLQDVEDVDSPEIMPPHTDINTDSTPSYYSLSFVVAGVYIILRKRFC